MRTTLAIDDDVLAAAKQLAARERKSLGKIISTLARQGLNQGIHLSTSIRNGVPLLPTRDNATVISPDLINRLHDENS